MKNLDRIEVLSSIKSYKTPLRYPGGKSRACKKMEPFFPDLRDYDVYYEPFLGGGSVALHITKKYPKLKIVNFILRKQDINVIIFLACGL